MENLDDSENNAKVSDSAYSNSCSNSQSRRSHSSKSTHSGSNSSGSSGYGGKTSTSDNSTTPIITPEKRVKDKECKKQKSSSSVAPPIEVVVEDEVPDNVEPPTEEVSSPEQDRLHDVPPLPPVVEDVEPAAQVESMDIATPDSSVGKVEQEGFWCLISMHDGIVVYTTPSITAAIGFPKDICIGRSFIDFVHQRDRNTFATQITRGLAAPKSIVTEENTCPGAVSSMFCRLRRYRGLSYGFGVKEKEVLYNPFQLKLSFKNMVDEHGKRIYLVVQATPRFSYFKLPNEPVTKAVPFILRHSAHGNVEYIGKESVPYLGYLPQELTDTNVLLLYHIEDLPCLKKLYEQIVNEGKAPIGDSLRMLTQNGGYVKVETEWSSFINPWSKKLEFVIGKHRVIEGPPNPDVFAQRPEEPMPKSTDEETKAQALRDSIVRVMSEMLTKPADAAEQAMSKRCQDLASFMETLMDEQAKTEDELRLDIHEPDHNYYVSERDSVMLGGISPHHEYNTGDSSTDTPLTYNQLNYNETLQRYFESYQPHPWDEYKAPDSEMHEIVDAASLINRMSPVAPRSTNSGDHHASTADSGRNHRDQTQLTETLINKHNVDMEKELVRKHREHRSGTKGEREKAFKENRLKKKEHLARCNASFQPTSVALMAPDDDEMESVFVQPHGVKRPSKLESGCAQSKFHCSSRQLRRKPQPVAMAATGPWNMPTPPTGIINLKQCGTVQQMPLVSTVAAVPGVFPMYYVPATTVPAHPPGSVQNNENVTTPQTPFQPTPVQYMLYPQPVFGSPFIYSGINPQVTFPMPERRIQGTSPTVAYQSTSKTEAAITLPTTNYENAEAAPTPGPSKSKRTAEERTDESSCSSFYSSFFKTESGSAEENSDPKNKGKANINRPTGSVAEVSGATESAKCAEKGQRAIDNAAAASQQEEQNKIARRKMQPPWMEQVCVTSELIYKYQLMSRNMDEVLVQDKKKMMAVEQSSLVNEQLDQLYIDLQLQGVAARLTLEEGITSSGSSSEETTVVKLHMPKQVSRKKREYSKLAMIYEEDAPIPSPPEDSEPFGTNP